MWRSEGMDRGWIGDGKGEDGGTGKGKGASRNGASQPSAIPFSRRKRAHQRPEQSLTLSMPHYRAAAGRGAVQCSTVHNTKAINHSSCITSHHITSHRSAVHPPIHHPPSSTTPIYPITSHFPPPTHSPLRPHAHHTGPIHPPTRAYTPTHGTALAASGVLESPVPSPHLARSHNSPPSRLKSQRSPDRTCDRVRGTTTRDDNAGREVRVWAGARARAGVD